MDKEALKAKAIEYPILFFDGDCALCNGSVKFLLNWNTSHNIYFSSLKSDAAQMLLGDRIANVADSDSLIVLHKDSMYFRTDGLIVLGSYLDSPVQELLKVVSIFPAFLRNGVYRLVSKLRYKIWGRTKSHCPVMKPEVRAYFLT